MVKAMEIVEEWAEDNDLGASMHDEYELAERMWALWESATKLCELTREDEGISRKELSDAS